MTQRLSHGWLLLEVCIASLLLFTVLLSALTVCYRQSAAVRQAQVQALADQLLANGVEILQLGSTVSPSLWQQWLALSHQRFPALTAHYTCNTMACTLCYYHASQRRAWRCLSGARQVLPS